MSDDTEKLDDLPPEISTDNEERELEELLSQFCTDKFYANIYRICPFKGERNYQFMTRIEMSDFSEESIAGIFGGGDYKANVYARTEKGIKTNFKFYIDYNRPAAFTNDQISQAQNGRDRDGLTAVFQQMQNNGNGQVQGIIDAMNNKQNDNSDFMLRLLEFQQNNQTLPQIPKRLDWPAIILAGAPILTALLALCKNDSIGTQIKNVQALQNALPASSETKSTNGLMELLKVVPAALASMNSQQPENPMPQATAAEQATPVSEMPPVSPVDPSQQAQSPFPAMGVEIKNLYQIKMPVGMASKLIEKKIPDEYIEHLFIVMNEEGWKEMFFPDEELDQKFSAWLEKTKFALLALFEEDSEGQNEEDKKTQKAN